MAGNLPAARWTRVSRPAQICDKIPQTFSMVRIPQKRKIVKPIFQFCGPDFPSANTNRLPLKRRAPIASVAAFPAQPLAALPPYGCGVPLAGSERLAGLQQGRHSFYGARPPDLSLRGGRRPTWQSRSTRPDRGKAIGEIATASPRFPRRFAPRNDTSGWCGGAPEHFLRLNAPLLGAHRP